MSEIDEGGREGKKRKCEDDFFFFNSVILVLPSLHCLVRTTDQAGRTCRMRGSSPPTTSFTTEQDGISSVSCIILCMTCHLHIHIFVICILLYNNNHVFCEKYEKQSAGMI